MQMIQSCDVSDAGNRRFPEVSVGETVITEDAIAAEMQYHAAEALEDAWHSAARSLVIRALLLQEVAGRNIDPVLDEEAQIAALLDAAMDVPAPDHDSCQRYFVANPERFRTPTLLAVSHVLLPAAPDDSSARTQQEDAGRALLRQLLSGQINFAETARAYSACESRKQGGQLGQISKGQTVEEFENSVWRLPEGLHDHLVESRYGWHIVRIDQRMEGRPLPYEHVEATIRCYLQEKVTRRWLRQYLQVLAAQTTVHGVDLELPDSPLLQ